MTTNDLITHLTALVAADASVGELPVRSHDSEYGLADILTPSAKPGEPDAFYLAARVRHVEL